MYKNIALVAVLFAFTLSSVTEARYTRGHVRPSTGTYVGGYWSR